MQKKRSKSPGMKRIEITLPVELVIEVDVLAARRSRSRSIVVEDLLREGLERAA